MPASVGRSGEIPARVVVPARAGLVGHPSDGYGGATLAVTLANFAAEVEVRRSPELAIEPAGAGAWPEGGEPLIRATVRRFCRHCAAQGVPFEPRVSIRYGSTIPREVGLAGSSAIVIGTLRALSAASGLPIEQAALADLALSVETQELGIAAGLQDRVVQAYGGLIFMDFETGDYESLDPVLLPELFVAWDDASGGGSDAAHAVVRARYIRGDRLVVAAMRTLAGLARDARAALGRADHDGFSAALSAGYGVRAAVFDLDPRHVALIDAARRLGLPATYTGSGGAIVGIATDPALVRELDRRLATRGSRLVTASICRPPPP